MYAQSNHIPQPPHTVGQPFQGSSIISPLSHNLDREKFTGHRTAVDPGQVPSHSDTLQTDCEQWENREFEPHPGSVPPLSTTNFINIDRGNASPRFVRLSTWSLPASASLAGECGIPIAGVFQPLADLDPREEEVPVVHCDEAGPMRCERCKGYVNPWGRWIAGGQRWSCNLCRHETDGAFYPVPTSICRFNAFTMQCHPTTSLHLPPILVVKIHTIVQSSAKAQLNLFSPNLPMPTGHHRHRRDYLLLTIPFYHGGIQKQEDNLNP